MSRSIFASTDYIASRSSAGKTLRHEGSVTVVEAGLLGQVLSGSGLRLYGIECRPSTFARRRSTDSGTTADARASRYTIESAEGQRY